MASTRTFQDMLNQHLHYSLLKEEMIKRNWLLQNVEKDDDWKGGSLIVPFKGSQASSVAFGSLTDTTDVAEDVYVRGSISTQPEVWGTIKFNHRDILEHDGKVNEKSFLKVLPDVLEDFLDYMKMVVNLNMLNGAAFATATANGDASGNLTVDRPERFVIGQKVSIDDGNSSPVTGYVRTINMDTGVITFYDARSSGSVVDLSGYTVAQAAKCYFDGSQSNGLTSLKLSLLSATNGGASTLYGQTKTAYPYLQAINVSGATMTAANALEILFDAYTTIKNRGKGKPDKIVMSYKHLGSIMKILESQKGAYHIDQASTKVNAFGWTEIVVFGVQGRLSIVGVQEMDDDFIMYLDMRAMKFHSNGFFRKRVAPDGKEYYEVRATTGYSYFLDWCMFGDLVLNRPSYCGVLHSISY